MIKLSKNNLASRLGAMVVCSLPMVIVILYAINIRYELPNFAISIVIIIILLSLNIYFNFFDYELYYNPSNKELIVKRYNEVHAFSMSEGFMISPYFFSISFGLQYYRLTISGKNFRFKYFYMPDGVHIIQNLEEASKKIHDELIQKIMTLD